MLCAPKPRFAPAIRAAHPGLGEDDVAELTRTETFALTAIAYLQPVTRGELSKLAGREISRDVIAALKRHGWCVVLYGSPWSSGEKPARTPQIG
jgi:chromosome segregation and condensation protein ScpB